MTVGWSKGRRQLAHRPPAVWHLVTVLCAVTALSTEARPAWAGTPRSPTAHAFEVYTTLVPRSFALPGSVLGVTVLAPRPFFFDAGIGMWPGTFYLLGADPWFVPAPSGAPKGSFVPWAFGAEVYAFAGWAGLSGHLWTYKLEIDGRFGGGYVQNLGAGGVGQLHGDLVSFADLEAGYEVTRGLGIGLRLRLGAQLVLDTGRTAPLFEDCLVIWW